ncbi:Protein DMR6-LIKE OXYGENASE 2 [Dichanthelium oligosanthes]|uniref:Protein DMR6-LIKE OXYGENASE 2 n=1 Tax=Dichanthelium oligosanthes TaxID=888268 RepID=A0A1E5VGQ3_9POAL|nr:Protein DMR6-LIKE OXYGENASE 2 [Dichanthelium oligosanthes]
MPACFLPASMASKVVQPLLSSSRTSPVINLGRLSKDPATRALAIQDIARACREQGCFQVVNHGVSKSIMKGALEAASEFFNLSPEHKEIFASTDIRRPIRYDTSSRDGISKARSFLKHYANPLENWVQYWPVHPPTYRKKMGDYAVEIQRVSMQLMDAILQGLGLEPLYLQEKLENGIQFLALNNYPQFSHRGDKVGLAPHSDYGFLTILLQSSPGLEVMPHDDNTWTAVPAIPGALHVHIGDHLEVLSNGHLKSLVHRAVLNPDEARISIASIHGLTMDEKVRCAEELVDEEHPEMYRESSFQDFLDFLPSNINNYKRFVESLKTDRA